MTEQLALDLEPPRQWRASALRSFHVRAHQTADEAQAGERNTRRQEDAILKFFQIAPATRYTPSEIHTMTYLGNAWPLTSVRRAITNLTTRGLLVHHPGDRRPGPYGAKESTWSYGGEAG